MDRKSKVVIVITLAVLLMVGAGYYFITKTDVVARGTGTMTAVSRVIKVGAVLPLTGDAANYGQSAKKGIEVALDKLAKENSSEFEVIFEDSQLDPTKAVGALKKLLDLDKVKYVIGYSSPELLAECPITEANKIILLGSGSAAAVTDCGDYTFRNYPSDIYQGKMLARLVSKGGHKRVAILYLANDYGVGLKEEFTKNFTGDSLFVEAHNPGAIDFRTTLIKMKDFDPSCVVVLSYYPEGVRLFKQMDELGVNNVPVFASEAVKDNGLLDSISERMQKNISLVFLSQYSGNEYKQYELSYRAMHNEPVGVYSDFVYDDVLLLAKALDGCPVDDTSCVKNNLYKINFVGATGPISFDSNGDVIEKEYGLYYLQDGQFVKTVK